MMLSFFNFLKNVNESLGVYVYDFPEDEPHIYKSSEKNYGPQAKIVTNVALIKNVDTAKDTPKKKSVQCVSNDQQTCHLSDLNDIDNDETNLNQSINNNLGIIPEIQINDQFNQKIRHISETSRDSYGGISELKSAKSESNSKNQRVRQITVDSRDIVNSSQLDFPIDSPDPRDSFSISTLNILDKKNRKKSSKGVKKLFFLKNAKQKNVNLFISSVN
jgi:hypothetical protein